MKAFLNPKLEALSPSLIRQFSNLASATPGCIRLTLGEPDFDTPAPVKAAVDAALAANETHYIANNGTLALRQAIAELESGMGRKTDADEVIVTAGATEALQIAFTGLLAPGDEVIIPTPAFVLYEQQVLLAGGVPVRMDISKTDFQIRNLQKHISSRTKAILLNSPNNPTGTLLDAESLEAVRTAVQGKPIFVICDDVYRQLVYTEGYHSFAEFDDMRAQTLLVQSFSKPYAMTGWRMGYLIADKAIVEPLSLIHQYTVTSTPSLFQRAGIAALEYDPTPMVETYKKRRDCVLTRLSNMGLHCVRPEGAFYVFPSIKHLGISDTEFCTRAIKEAGVALTPGSCFGAKGYVRLSYCVSEQELCKGLDRLEQFIKSL